MQERVPWAVYGTYSGFHLFVNPSELDIGPYNFEPTKSPLEDMKNQPKALVNKLRLAMLITAWISIRAAAGCCPARTRPPTLRTQRRHSAKRSAC